MVVEGERSPGSLPVPFPAQRPPRPLARWWPPSVLVLVLFAAAAGHAQECSNAICVGDPCTISGTHLLTDNCLLDFGTKSVTVTGNLVNAIDGGSFFINARNLTVQGKLQASGGELDIDLTGDFTLAIVDGSVATINVNEGGQFTLSAGGNVTLNGSEVTVRGKDGSSAGDILIEAGGNISVGYANTLVADGGLQGDGGTITLLADGDINLGGNITADGSGSGSSGGNIDVEAGVSGTLTVSRTLEAITSNSGVFDGEIDLGPACTVIITGSLKTRNSNLASGHGANDIQYTGSLHVSGGTIKSDAGGNEIDCRCVDTNNDELCDGGCISPPAGLAQATLTPTVTVVPLPMPPCGCGNGIVEPSLGEQCDDGNIENFDGCRYDCRLPYCGDRIVDPGEQCDHGTKNGASSDCCSGGCRFQAAGSSCSDGNGCTQTDQCDGKGSCVGSNTVVCSALDQCHVPGTCNPVWGCSNPPKANGTACNDNNACTSGETCQNGTCGSPTSTVTCTALDQCHNAGTCNSATGVCSNPTKPNGTACNDGNSCTVSDVCTAGVCTGSCNVGTVCASGCGGSLHCQQTSSGCQCQ